MGRLTRLCQLNLSDNKLTDVPVSLGYCISLGRIGSGISLDRNPIASVEMLQCHRLGADRLLFFLEERLKNTENAPTWEELKSIPLPQFKSYEELEEERKYLLKGFVNDISVNPELQQKAVLLRGWAKNQLSLIKKYLQEKHLSFMAANTMDVATERSVPLKTIDKVVS
jgi:Leucine-rich repeat (LRR) protein